ncbi:Fic family protein [soil metagenome]
MKIEAFKAGAWRQRYQYKSFEPTTVNQQWTWEDPKINTLLEEATRALGELNAYSLIVPDIDLFIRMHVVKEAQTSSRIEGTETGFKEALMPEDQIRPAKRNDWQEVQNYIDALNSAVTELKTLPLANRLLTRTHSVLMSGVRGQHKAPGEFRTSQNWIGGSSLADATFIPAHWDGLSDLMSDLEKFWHNQEIAVPHLIRIAISHYQFETIHPFLDGNGRIGRLLIPLYLISHGLLAKPALYMSDFFDRNRGSYFDSLMRVRLANDLAQWVKFFLVGMAETAHRGRRVFSEIMKLRGEVETEVLKLGRRAATGKQALNILYSNPVINAMTLATALGVSEPTANALIVDLIRLKILVEMTGQRRRRTYSFNRYLALF